MFDLSLEMLRVVEDAAIASARTMGMGDAKAADQAAVESMRRCLDTIAIEGTIVIGEGERDEAPMLYIGEKVGARKDNDGAMTRGYRRGSAGRHQPVRHRRRGRRSRCWRRPSTAACCTRRIATWKRSWWVRPPKARWIWTRR